jgi:hypothetical protein
MAICMKVKYFFKVILITVLYRLWSLKVIGDLYQYYNTAMVEGLQGAQFSLPFQAGVSPCTSGGGKSGRKSILGSCIARTSSEEELQLELAKRPISPGHRGTTWNGKQRGSSGDQISVRR